LHRSTVGKCSILLIFNTLANAAVSLDSPIGFFYNCEQK
jgi:hypothetical protein